MKTKQLKPSEYCNMDLDATKAIKAYDCINGNMEQIGWLYWGGCELLILLLK